MSPAKVKDLSVWLTARIVRTTTWSGRRCGSWICKGKSNPEPGSAFDVLLAEIPLVQGQCGLAVQLKQERCLWPS